MVLHGGRATVNGRRSPSSLHDFNLATYETGDTFDQSSSRGFIDIYGMQSKLSRCPRCAFRREHGPSTMHGGVLIAECFSWVKSVSVGNGTPTSHNVSCMTYEASAAIDAAAGIDRDDTPARSA